MCYPHSHSIQESQWQLSNFKDHLLSLDLILNLLHDNFSPYPAEFISSCFLSFRFGFNKFFQPYLIHSLIHASIYTRSTCTVTLFYINFNIGRRYLLVYTRMRLCWKHLLLIVLETYGNKQQWTQHRMRR